MIVQVDEPARRREDAVCQHSAGDVPTMTPRQTHGGGGPGGSVAAGSGLVELAVVNGRTEVVRLRAESPIRLLVPRSRSAKPFAAWVVGGSYGGGLVAGDRLAVALRCGPGTTAVLGTQASTKVYRFASGRRTRVIVGSGQTLDATLADRSVLVAWPDPVTCFAGSRYEQRQAFDLAASASLLAVDWVTSGRMARGERWAFDRYASTTTIRVGGRLLARESTTLDPADGPLDAVARTGGFDCLGAAWIVGPAFADVAAGLVSRLGRTPIDPRLDVMFGVSTIPGGPAGTAGGAVLRFAGRGSEAASRWLREQLAGALGVVGIDPWARRG